MTNAENRVIVVPSEYDQILDQLGEALMCATDHLDFDSLAISHCTSLQAIQRGLAVHAERTGDEAATKRANWTA
jgi:hypothetical protein